MRKLTTTYLLVAAIYLLAAGYGLAAHKVNLVMVEKVVDGDTILVSWLNSRKVEYLRLVGIDAPEIGQPYGCAAAWWLNTRLHSQVVTVKVVARDKYGRLLGSVKLGRSDPALGLVKAGLAWGLRQPYIDAMTAARKAKLGLWAQRNPIHPAAYRRRAHKKPQTPSHQE